MKKIIAVLFLLFFLISCGDDSDTPFWVNMYDPDVDENKRKEVCGTMECGETDFEGHMLLCGICMEDEYCDQDRKCVSSCEHYNCGTMSVETWSGNKNIDCGTCEGSEHCGTNNICIAEDDVCGTKDCGKVYFTSIDSENIEISCGTCEEGEYCSISQECELKSDNCKDKCGTFSINSYGGSTEIECDSCEGEFAYCSTENKCETACAGKECGTEEVTLEGNVNKSFTCGSCGDGMNYCDSNYNCQIACESQECGKETVYKLEEGETSVECGACSSPDYCDATLNCTEGSQSGDYIYDTDIVVDTVSGLMWHRASVSEFTSEGAFVHCSSSGVAGFSDWQLPDITQLRSIVSGCDKVGTGIDTVTGDDAGTCGVTSVCTDSTCSNDNCQGCTNSAGSGPQGLYLAADIWNYAGDANGRFWSSSSVPDKADSYWFIRFSNASVAYNWDGSEYNVICVRETD